MQATIIQRPNLSEINRVLKTNKIQLSFKDPRERGRILTIDIDRVTFKDLIDKFSKDEFILNQDGSVELKGEVNKYISKWWEKVAYEEQSKSSQNRVNIRAYREVENPYIKENYIKIGLLNRTFQTLNRVMSEDGKTLKTEWLSKGVDIQERSNLDYKRERIPTDYLLRIQNILRK